MNQHQPTHPYIFIDPDGTHNFGLMVIAGAPTGVKYAHQCGGLDVLHRSMEGFVIPVGGPTDAAPIRKFFRERFHGYPPLQDAHSDVGSGSQWTPDLIAQLDVILANIVVWMTYPPEEQYDDYPQVLHLDTTRLKELTEGWVPVTTVYGPAILVFANSD